MNPTLKVAVEDAIVSATQTAAQIFESVSCSGGCINQAEVVRLTDGRSFFVKSNADGAGDLFEQEALGLQTLAEVGAIKVPDVVVAGTVAGSVFLVLEAIEPLGRRNDFSVVFGQQLACLHKRSSEDRQRYGFNADNYLGSTRQPNTWAEDWCDFWLRNRMEFQFELARRNGYSDGGFSRAADRLVDRLPSLLQTNESAALIHGDLWSGNYMVGAAGEPVLIDPAVYYAHREAEFGMTTLFGGFDDRFYDAYNSVWPLEDGAEERIAIYRLYHSLNHLNLFGASYLSDCLDIMKKFT